MKNTIVLWGVGWLGIPLAQSLQKAGNSVWCITRSEEKKAFLVSHGIHASTLEVFQQNGPLLSTCSTFIIALPPTKDSDFLEQMKQTIQLLPAETHIIYTSSIGVYLPTSGLVDENSPIDETHDVAQIEKLVSTYKPDKSTFLRLGGLIGPKRHPVHFLAKRNQNVNPNQVVNLVHQEDVIRVIEAMVQTPFFGVFNVCSSEHPTRKEYYNEAATAFGLEPISFENSTNESGKIVDSSKLVRLFPDAFSVSIYHFESCK
jgi:nucleoside-diphosphate-sugar epimerase